MRITEEKQAELEAKAVADFKAMVGEIITVTSVTGYDDHDNSQDFYGEFKVKVTSTPESDIRHWCDEFLDPYWNVDIVEPVPDVLKGCRSFWTYGPSYEAK